MGDSAASVGVLVDGAGLGAGTPHRAVTKAVHETEELPVVSENGKIDESCVESPQGAPARPSSPAASPPCSDSMTPAAAPDKEAQTVTSSQTSHSRTSLESTVSMGVQGMGGGLLGDVQSQAVQNFSSQSQVTHSQSIQSGSVNQSHTTTTVSGQQSAVSVSQSQSAKNVSQSLTEQSDTQSQAAASVLEDPADQPRAEPSSVDENANSIPEQEEVPALPEPAEAPEGVVAQAATEAPEPVVVQEPALEPSVVPEPAAVPKPALEPTAEEEPTVIQKPEATPEPSVAPEETVVQEPAAPPEPIVVQAMAEEQESAPSTEPESVAAPEPQPAAPEPQPAAPEPQPAAPEPQPAAPEPQPSAPEPQPAVLEPQPPAPEPQPATPEQQPAAPESQPSAPEPQPAVPEPQPPAPEPQPATPEPQPATETLETTAATEPVPADQPEPPRPEPTPEVEPMTAPQPEPCVETTVNSSGAGVEEISQEHIKEQLHEIISEIEQQVLPEQELQLQEEDGVLHHTWKPKGRYEVPKTVIQYEEVVPITVADVAFSLKAQPPKPAPPPQPEPQHKPQPSMETRQEPQSLTNGAVSPIEIPEGIPLLARILPKDHEDGEKKISLERLFTPATDSGDLTPKRSPSKKAFASSSFYRPDHPTIDDQVELAQRISFSLVDENNKMSRGQSMYMKRKKRSMRWIHAGADNDEDATGAGEGCEGQEEEQTLKHPPAKPPMKLLMSPKGVQDFHAVQEHYQALMEAAIPTSPEVGKIVTEVQSPTGKGAELFAKRKKRMDKFIVDETTVQKAQTSSTTTTTTSTRTHQQQSLTTAANDLALKKSAVEERNRQQQEILEQFLRSREQSLTLVKSPWQAAMETGSADAAFDDKRQRIKLANTVCERADTKLAQAEAWLEPPKTVPLVASPLAAEVTGTSAAPPVGPAAIYSAEVKVMQRSSLPLTPALHVPRSLLNQTDKSNRRNSLNFNQTAKGWGTYTNFYSPVNFAT